MEWFHINYVGYLAAALIFSTFYMKRMIPLRAVGICANVTFIIFAGYTNVWPLLVLHACLVPLNLLRMLQMIRLVKEVKEAATGKFSMEFLVPFMTKENHSKGDVVFRKGDKATKMYFLKKGLARLEENEKLVSEGELVGEMAIFSPNKMRTATLVCVQDTQFLSIPDKQVLELYYQNPKFGFYLIQMITQRFLQNIENRG